MAKTKELSRLAKKVYRVVITIPLGEVRTYQWVAKRVGHPRSVRAIGQILKRNPYPFLIPCHRVVGVKGISGYIFGVKTKKALLDLEQRIRVCLENKR